MISVLSRMISSSLALDEDTESTESSPINLALT